MPLTKQQLLIPRVLCIGTKEGEPNDTSGKYITGTVLTLYHDVFSIRLDKDGFDYTHPVKKEIADSLPHLFKPLPWWYGRTVDEMPEYVKCIQTPDQVHFPDECFKVNWKLSHLGFSDRGAIVPNTDCYQPADESEYQEYQKLK